MKLSKWLLLFFAATNAFVSAQSNPVPFVNQPLIPAATVPGSAGFTLTVNGTGFVTGAVVDWNGTALPTTFVSSSRLTAAVPAANVAKLGTASVTVVNPSPGGGTSNVLELGNGDGTFRITNGPLFGNYGNSFAVGDFNGDGKLDLLLNAVAGYSSPCCASGFFTALGNGDGTFQNFIDRQR